MDSFRLALVVVATIAFAFSCWLVFWTDAAVKFARTHTYRDADPAQETRRSHIAFEPWYPLYLRFEGIWMWILIAFLFSLTIKG